MFFFICNSSTQSPVEELNFVILSRLDPETSRNSVKGVLSLPNLKTLMLDGIGNLDESCFTTFTSYLSKCQVRLCYLKEKYGPALSEVSKNSKKKNEQNIENLM